MQSSSESTCGECRLSLHSPVGKKKKLRDLLPFIVDRIAAIKLELVVARISQIEEEGLLDELRRLRYMRQAAE